MATINPHSRHPPTPRPGGGSTTSWRAPGRVNLIGEHTDYNDGFVLPMALSMGCVATVETGSTGLEATSAQQPERVVVPVSGLAEAPDVPSWSRYVLGAAWLLHDRGVQVPPLRIHVDSDVPVGAGLSSSAAVVCSVVRALDDHLSLARSDDEVLALARAVENDVVGAPTGGMDQLVSLRAVAGHALLCDMRDLSVRPVPFDPGAHGLSLLVVDTRAPHRHADGDYGARRRVCAEAAAILGVIALRDLTLRDVAEGDAAQGGLDAALARLPTEEHRRCTRHVVTENDRVLRTAGLLDAGDLRGVGPLLSESHASMRDDFRITVPEVDTAVDTLLASGALGARMTGGGFGGCVIALVEAGSVDTHAEAVRRAFAGAGFAEPVTFTATARAGARRV